MLTFYRKHTVENRIKHIFSLNQENDENCLLRNSTGEMNEYFHRKKIFNGIYFPGKSTGVGCHFLLQGFFPNWGSNPGLWHCRQTLYPLSHQGSLPILEYNWLTMLWKFQVYRKVIHLYIYMHLFKMITGIMTDKTISRYNVDSKDIVKFKDTVKFLKNFLYNVWHSCIKNVYTYRYNLGNLSISTYLIMLLIWFSFPNKPN